MDDKLRKVVTTHYLLLSLSTLGFGQGLEEATAVDDDSPISCFISDAVLNASDLPASTVLTDRDARPFQLSHELHTPSAAGCDCACHLKQTEAALPADTGPLHCETCCHGRLIDWSKYPETIHPLARPGNFPIPVTQGPGYFTLWDQLVGECRPGQYQSGYPPIAPIFYPFFDSNWKFVDGIPIEERTFVERLKRRHLNDCLLFSTGGQFWARWDRRIRDPQLQR